ncbi:unnamed protein product [Calypogeia fissa]
MEEFPPETQLVCEWYTPLLSKTLEFLKSFGFVVLREEEAHFAELAWKSSKNRLMVEQMEGFVLAEDGKNQQNNPQKFGWHGYVGNIRVMVPDVDSVYEVALRTEEATILKELENRYYGLRDFTVGGPFGIALRFATPLPEFRES